MTVTGPQARAARVLIQWPRDHVARLTKISTESLADFETGRVAVQADVAARLQAVLEGGGAVFLDETADLGPGVRLKFPTRDLRPIGRMENEGGPVGDDDV